MTHEIRTFRQVRPGRFFRERQWPFQNAQEVRLPFSTQHLAKITNSEMFLPNNTTVRIPLIPDRTASFRYGTFYAEDYWNTSKERTPE